MNGVLLVDKPSGCTSHDVVRTARKILGTRKVGHAGTLDPLASGLLILLVGQATKLSDYLLNGDKGYVTDILLGQTTDTLDVTGELVEEKQAEWASLDYSGALSEMTGDLELEVPAFSAVKVDGKKLYEYARAGEEAPRLVRESSFYDIEWQGRTENVCRVAMKCSKGSYIRAWVHEFGQRLGCGATVKTLRRTMSSPFEVGQTLTIEELEMGDIDAGYLTMEEALPHWSRVDVSGFDEKLLLNGQLSKGLQGNILQSVAGSSGLNGQFRVVSAADNRLLALVESSRERGLEICRVFPRI